MTCAELGPARKNPLPTNGNSFVACSMPKVLHTPAECVKVVIDFGLVFLPRMTISRLHTHTHTCSELSVRIVLWSASYV